MCFQSFTGLAMEPTAVNPTVVSPTAANKRLVEEAPARRLPVEERLPAEPVPEGSEKG